MLKTVYELTAEPMKRFVLLLFTVLMMTGFSACSEQNHNELREVVINISADNRIIADGQPMHLSKLQSMVEDTRSKHELKFVINADKQSCIHRINDITRIVHPDPVQFASAE